MQNTQPEPNKAVIEYIEVVSDVLEAYYAHSLRNLPENFGLIVSHWTNLFMKVGIPKEDLMDVYLEAHSNMSKGDFFNADTILATWNDRREIRLKEEQKKEGCTVCKNTKKTVKYNFKLRVDETIDCPACV